MEAIEKEQRLIEHQAKLKQRALSEIRPIEQIVVEKKIRNLKRQFAENHREANDLFKAGKLTEEKRREIAKKEQMIAADYREGTAKLDYLRNSVRKEDYDIAVLEAKEIRAKAEYDYFMSGVGKEIPEKMKEEHETLQRKKDETMIDTYDARMARAVNSREKDRGLFRSKVAVRLLNKAEVDEARKRISVREKLGELIKPLGDPKKKSLFED